MFIGFAGTVKHQIFACQVVVPPVFEAGLLARLAGLSVRNPEAHKEQTR